jgi:hypothetical protein
VESFGTLLPLLARTCQRALAYVLQAAYWPHQYRVVDASDAGVISNA